ncbi:MAG: extracellular solute-binding protein [Bdellovibrionales bacterium]|nr:extracellular solute-binding protein [Bdellovibrionales bacterium]
MNARFLSRGFLALGIAVGLAVAPSRASGGDLVVYTYDTLSAKDGLGSLVAAAFKKKTGTAVKFVSVGDSGQLLSRVQLDGERKKATAHLVLGMDQNLFPRLREFLEPLDPVKDVPFMKYVDREYWLADGFIPFDYGILAFIADTKKLSADDFPKKWKDLTKGRFKKSLLLEDPRTSSPGLGFVWGSMHAAAEAEGEAFPPVSTTEDNPATPKKTRDRFTEFWSDLKSQWVTLAPGWGAAYGMFTKGEAPLVWSYVTSEAYHRMKGAEGDRERYRAVVFEDGHPVQVEGAGLLKNAPGGAAMRKRAIEFLELLVSEEIQRQVPETQWMMPTRLGSKVPAAFQALPTVKRRFPLSATKEKIDDVLADWSAAIR